MTSRVLVHGLHGSGLHLLHGSRLHRLHGSGLHWLKRHAAGCLNHHLLRLLNIIGKIDLIGVEHGWLHQGLVCVLDELVIELCILHVRHLNLILGQRGDIKGFLNCEWRGSREYYRLNCLLVDLLAAKRAKLKLWTILVMRQEVLQALLMELM